MPISPEYLPSELHYIIPLAERHGTDARVAQYDRRLGRHVEYAETLTDDDIEPLRQLYAEISAKGHGPLISRWHQSHDCKGTCPPETTWPVYGLLCLFAQLGRLAIVPFSDGVVCPQETEEAGRPLDETTLEFDGPAFTDAALKAIPNLDKVEMLSLCDTAVTDKGFGELLRAQALVEVSIISDTLSDTVLQMLAQLPALRSLQIHRGPRIGDNGVRHLAGCVGLRELYLKETAVTDQGLRAIYGLPEVWSLILDGTAVSNDGCASLADMPRLSLLSLNRTRVAGHGLARLRDNEHFNAYLEETPTTDDGVIALAGHLSNLKLLSLNHTGVGDPAARALSRLLRLNDVRFSHTRLTDAGLSAFAGHPYLDVIYVEGCAVTRNAVKALKNASPRELTVYGP